MDISAALLEMQARKLSVGISKVKGEVFIHEAEDLVVFSPRQYKSNTRSNHYPAPGDSQRSVTPISLDNQYSYQYASSRRKHMLFAIDIDGTIAGTDHGREYAHYLNRVLGIGMSEEKVAGFSSYREFALSAEVQAFGAVSQDNQDRYMEALELAQHDAEVQRASLPLPGAVEGVTALSTYGRIIYVTCRYASARELSQEWLSEYGFPNPEQIFTCERFHHKFVEAQKNAFNDEPIVLIDDHAEDIVKTFRKLVKEYYQVAKSVYGRCGLVAFGTDKAPTAPNQLRIPMLALPSWDKEEIRQLIGIVL